MNNDSVVYYSVSSLNMERLVEEPKGVYNLYPDTSTLTPMGDKWWFRFITSKLCLWLTPSSLFDKLINRHYLKCNQERDKAIKLLMDHKVLTQHSAYSTNYSYEVHTLDLEQLAYILRDALYGADQELRMLYDQRVDFIIVGHTIMEKLLHSQQTLQPISFRMPSGAGPKLGGKYMFDNIEVKVVPWFDGILVVPVNI